jgi:surfeit locus 1 family protein
MNSIAKPALIAIVGAGAIAATLSLGFWQVRRGAEKESMQRRVDDASRATPIVPSQQQWMEPASLDGRHVSITGRWLPEKVVYLDNRPMAGRAGRYVLMALRTEGAASHVIVVNRGWIPRDANERTRIAPYRTSTDTVTITGIGLAEEPRLLEIGAMPTRSLAGLWQNFAFDEFQRLSGESVVPLVIRQDHGSTPDDGLDRDWPDRGATLQSQIDRHHGYAFQWFALAATIAALLLFQLFRIVRNSRGIHR